MEIRKLIATDLPALLDLYEHLHETDDPRPAQLVVDAFWQEILASHHFHYVGGFEGTELVSSCNLTVIPNLTRGCRPYGVIENVVTHAAYRGRGHAKALLAEALDTAWSADCYKLMLMTGRKDEATLKFYESAGFDRHGKQAFIAKPPSGAR